MAGFLGRVRALFSSAPAPAKRLRTDALENALLGIGTDRDKIAAGSFVREAPLTDEQLAAAFYFEDLPKKIVMQPVKEMFRRGYEIEGDDGETLEELAKALELDKHLSQALAWARLYGSAIAILGARDGRMPWEPLNVEAVTEISYINVVDRRTLVPYAFYNNPAEPKYGQVSVYLIQPDGFGQVGIGGAAAPGASLIHESRVIRFDGVEEIDHRERIRLNGWSYSVLQAPYRVVKQFTTAFESAGFLIADMSQGVFKIQGLIDMIASGEGDTMQARMMLVDMMRSSGRSIMVDAEGEDFQRVTTPISGLPDLIDRFMMRMASAADRPVTVLFGRSAAGLNATGENDIRGWYDSIASDQDRILRPAIERFCAVATRGTWKGKITFCPLWEPTDKEKAETEKLEADTDAVLITAGVVYPEQVALARYADTPIEETIDKPALEKAIKAEYELAANPPPEPMAMPGAMPPKPTPGAGAGAGAPA